MAMYHLAQINIGRMNAPLTDPIMHGFVSRLDEINKLAESSPGYIWRLQTDEGNATAIKVYEDERIIINMSVWESIDALFNFTYKTVHTQPLRERSQYFEKMEIFMTLWWIPVGHIPTALEGKERLEHYQAHGPTPHAFSFKNRFPMPETEPAK
jgi:hypothetical protein